MLSSEEYIEQTFFFENFLTRLEDGVSTQEFLITIRQELLETTNLPKAVDFLLSDMKHTGVLSAAMKQLKHYFTPFQTFVISESERGEGRFDFRIALQILAREAKYRCENPPVQGIFFYQFETICRNRLGYDKGITVLMQDDLYDSDWKDWFKILRRQIGFVDFAEMIYVRSEYYGKNGRNEEDLPRTPPPVSLFGEREGRIAYTTRRREPMFLFAALSRHLGYPAVPRQKRAAEEDNVIPLLRRRVEQLENRIQTLEEELRGGINLQRHFVTEEAKK